MRPHTCCQILFGISMHCFDDKRKGSLQQQKQICPSENEVNIITSELLLNASMHQHSPATWNRNSSWWDWWKSHPVRYLALGKSWSPAQGWRCLRRCRAALEMHWADNVLSRCGKKSCTRTAGTVWSVHLYSSSCCLAHPSCSKTPATSARRRLRKMPGEEVMFEF